MYISNPAPPPSCSKLESVRGWRTEVNETAEQDGEGERAGERERERGRARVCAKCESVTVSAHTEEGGGRRTLKREGRDPSRGRQRQTIMLSKLRRYERRAKGTGRRISGIDNGKSERDR